MAMHLFGPIENQLIVGYYKRGNRLDPTRVQPVFKNVKTVPFSKDCQKCGILFTDHYQTFAITNGKQIGQDFRVVTQTDCLDDSAVNLLSRGLGYRITFTKVAGGKPLTGLFASLALPDFEAQVDFTDIFGTETYHSFQIGIKQLEEHCGSVGYTQLKSCLNKYDAAIFESTASHIKITVNHKVEYLLLRLTDAEPPESGVPSYIKEVWDEFKVILGDLLYETLPKAHRMLGHLLLLIRGVSGYIKNSVANKKPTAEALSLLFRSTKILAGIIDSLMAAEEDGDQLSDIKQILSEGIKYLENWTNANETDKATFEKQFGDSPQTFGPEFISTASILFGYHTEDVFKPLLEQKLCTFGGIFFLQSLANGIDSKSVEKNGLAPLDNLLLRIAKFQLSSPFPTPKIYATNNFSLLLSDPVTFVKNQPQEIDLSRLAEGDVIKIPSSVRGSFNVLPDSDLVLFRWSEKDKHEIKLIDLNHFYDARLAGKPVDEKIFESFQVDPNMMLHDLYPVRVMTSYSGLNITYSGDPRDRLTTRFRFSHLPLKYQEDVPAVWAHLDLSSYMAQDLQDQRPNTFQIRESKRTKEFFISNTYPALRLDRLDGKDFDLCQESDQFTIVFFCCKYNPKSRELKYVAHKWLNADFFHDEDDHPHWHDSWVETSQAMYCCMFYLPQTKVYVVRYRRGRFESVGKLVHNDLRYFDFSDSVEKLLPMEGRSGLAEIVGYKRQDKQTWFARLSLKY